MRKSVLKLVWAVIAAIALPAGNARAETVDEIKVAKIKSAYLLNFIRFTTWPDGSFTKSDSPIVIGVLGRDSLGRILDQTVEGQAYRGRRIEVRRIAYTPPADNDPSGGDAASWARALEPVAGCRMLFISRSEEPRLEKIFSGLAGADVLTVSDIPGFAEHGGMIGFALRRGRIVFDANPNAIGRTGVEVSSKLLKLARLVQTVEGADP